MSGLIDKHTASGRFDAYIGRALLTSRERRAIALRKQIDQAELEHHNIQRVIQHQIQRRDEIVSRLNDLNRRYENEVTQTTD
jgi:Trp operon repressor